MSAQESKFPTAVEMTSHQGDYGPLIAESACVRVQFGPSMRKAILLYNPLSGQRQRRRVGDVQRAASILRSAGVDASTAPTRAAGEASEQVKEAIADGSDAVFACGGDGTVHDVLQGLVGTEAALAIIPLGTANSLAHDLRLPLSPAGAAETALKSTPRRIAVGRIEYQDLSAKCCSRYFTVCVGIGADAHLFYKLNPLAKRHLGMAAYYVKATRLWLTHSMPHFGLAFGENVEPRSCEVTQLLAVRIRDFGGMLRELAPGASLERDDLRLVLFHTRSRIAYLRYILRGLFATKWTVPGIELIHASEIRCDLLNSGAESSRIFVEADGELLGTLPAKISMVPNALTLLVP